MLRELISSLLACMQQNVALLNAEISYARRRLDICKLFTLSTGQNGRQKELKRVGKQCRVDADIFVSGKKKLRIQKYPDTCGRGLKILSLDGIPKIYQRSFDNIKVSIS